FTAFLFLGAQAGPVIKVKIPKDRDGRPKQFAFVNFKHEESVPYGLSLLNGIKLYGRPIKIQFRSGSSHASQDGNPSCSPHGAANTSPSGTPHPASSCSRYEPRQPVPRGHARVAVGSGICTVCCVPASFRFGFSSLRSKHLNS
uniref:RRM domain-containing protein n=1 Tax=Athene cunicularia TaxID=194338 RepID=A0A663M266_ATHCN